MPDRNLFTDGIVTQETLTNGVLAHTNGMGLVQPWPMFEDWDTTPNDPSLEGMLVGSYIVYSWIHGGYLYIWYYHNHTNSNISGLYRRTIVGDSPTHTVHSDFISLSDLFNLGGVNNRPNATFYDPVEEAVYLSRYYTSAQTGILGKWLMSNWPFTNGNAEWIAVDSTYGSYAAGKIANSARYILVADGKVFLASEAVGHVITLDASDGSPLGEWVYYGVYTGAFYLFGWDASNSRPVGGNYFTTTGAKAINTWDISDLNAWVAVDTVLPKKNGHLHNEEVHGSPLVDLYNGPSLNVAVYSPLDPSEVDALSYLPAGTIMASASSSYYSSGNCFVEMNLDGTVYHRHAPASCARLAGISGQRSIHTRGRVCTIDGVAYLQMRGFGTPKMLSVNEPFPLCPYFQHVDEGTYINRFTASATEIPKKLLIDLDPSARNREFSRHEGKHGFELSINGGAYTVRRAGHQLLRLNEVVDGLAAWESWNEGDVIRIRHTMTAGLFRHLLSNVYTEEAGQPGEELASLFDAGAPKEVQPILQFEGEAFEELGGGIA